MITPHDPDRSLIDDTIVRGLTPGATVDDVSQLSQWMEQSERRAHFVEGLRRVAHATRDTSGDPREQEATDAAWKQLATRLELPAHDHGARTRAALRLERSVSQPRPKWARRLAGIAAVLAVVSLSFAWWRGQPHELVAPRGQRVSATLPDGSAIMLAAGSRARWARGFGNTERTVEIEGEAWFDVAHDQSRPFRVRAGHVVAEDIGTRFVLRAWQADTGVEVAVEEGVVALADSARRDESGTVVRAGQRAYAVRGRTVVITDDAHRRLAWTTGALDFDNTPLRDAAMEIERWYDVTVKLDSTLHGKRLSARFERQPLPQLLNALSLALSVRVQRTGDLIVIAP